MLSGLRRKFSDRSKRKSLERDEGPSRNVVTHEHEAGNPNGTFLYEGQTFEHNVKLREDNPIVIARQQTYGGNGNIIAGDLPEEATDRLDGRKRASSSPGVHTGSPPHMTCSPPDSGERRRPRYESHGGYRSRQKNDGSDIFAAGQGPQPSTVGRVHLRNTDTPNLLRHHHETATRPLSARKAHTPRDHSDIIVQDANYSKYVARARKAGGHLRPPDHCIF